MNQISISERYVKFFFVISLTILKKSPFVRLVRGKTLFRCPLSDVT